MIPFGHVVDSLHQAGIIIDTQKTPSVATDGSDDLCESWDQCFSILLTSRSENSQNSPAGIGILGIETHTSESCQGWEILYSFLIIA